MITVATSALIARPARKVDQGRSCSRLDAHEEAGSNGGRQEQSDVERTEMATRHRHRQGIGGERQGQQQHAQSVEAGPLGLRPPAIHR
jgi:hypothetical protein